MIERFNFYDIYGYLLPGLVLGTLIGLPLALIAQKLPPAELGSALAAAVLGYALGHLSHAMARRLFGETRPFSSQIAALSEDARTKMKQRLEKLVGWPIALEDPAVFSMCRRALQDRKRGQVADQFQGMYALTRGLSIAFYTAASFYAGISVQGLRKQPHLDWDWLFPLGGVLIWLVAALLNEGRVATISPAVPAPQKPAAAKIPPQQLERIAAVVAIFVLGLTAGAFVPMHPHRFMAFGISAPAALLFAIRMHRVSSEHDANVAKSVIRDFLVEPPLKPPEDEKTK